MEQHVQLFRGLQKKIICYIEMIVILWKASMLTSLWLDLKMDLI